VSWNELAEDDSLMEFRIKINFLTGCQKMSTALGMHLVQWKSARMLAVSPHRLCYFGTDAT